MRNDQVLKVELAIKDNILKSYSFTQDVVDIGRIPTADIFIDNSGISRQHTRIERSIGGPFIVKDMGSTNGTFLNDMQVNEAALKSGDVVNLGKFSLMVTIESDEDSEEDDREYSPEDFDGTTVLSAEQLARLRAGIENDSAAASGASAGSADTSDTSGTSMAKIVVWCGVIVAAIIIGYLMMR